MCRRNAEAGAITQSDILAAHGVVKERIKTDRRVAPAFDITNERTATSGGVESPGSIAKQRIKAGGCVVTCRIVAEGKSTGSRVAGSCSIAKKCGKTRGGVVVGGIDNERASASG